MNSLFCATLLLALASVSAFQSAMPKARQSVQMQASKSQNAAMAAAVLGAALAMPNAAFAGDAANGEQLFDANCAACHAGGQNVIMPEKTLEKAALEQYLDGGRSEASVVKQVTNGKNAMPAFGGRLADDEIGDLAAYVIKQSGAGW